MPNRYYLAAVVSVFSLTTLFLLWHQRSERGTNPAGSAPLTATGRMVNRSRDPQVRIKGWQMSTTARTRQGSEGPGDSTPQSEASPQSEGRRSPTTDSTGAPVDQLPVALNSRPDRGNPPFLQVAMANLSKGTLTVSVTLSDPSRKTQAHTEVTLDQYESRMLGAGDGLEFKPGDQLTLQNPAYSERVITLN
jgi:hypothetical protein